MTISKRHHYTPRYYLKRFETDASALRLLDSETGALAKGNNARFGLNMGWNFDVLPQLQANFAFTKVYLPDAAGSRFGFTGARFFVDELFFAAGVPSWIQAEGPIAFHDAKLGLSASFLPVSAIGAPGALDDAGAGLRILSRSTQLAHLIPR